MNRFQIWFSLDPSSPSRSPLTSNPKLERQKKLKTGKMEQSDNPRFPNQYAKKMSYWEEKRKYSMHKSEELSKKSAVPICDEKTCTETGDTEKKSWFSRHKSNIPSPSILPTHSHFIFSKSNFEIADQNSYLKI